jgi:hypothetical protein
MLYFLFAKNVFIALSKRARLSEISASCTSSPANGLWKVLEALYFRIRFHCGCAFPPTLSLSDVWWTRRCTFFRSVSAL